MVKLLAIISDPLYVFDINPGVKLQNSCRCASDSHFPVIIGILAAGKDLSGHGCQFLPLFNDNPCQIFSAVFRMIPVNLISAFRPLKEILALMTIIGSYKKIIRKFDRQTRSCP
jgi:hypothetical protein